VGSSQADLGTRAERDQVDSVRAHGESDSGALRADCRAVHPRRPPASGKPDVSADQPNALWTADYKGWWRTGDLKRCEPLTVRDQHSRFVLAVHVCRSPRIDEALRLFDRLFELHGLPQRILTDNGTPFVANNSRFGLTRLSAWWLSLGIDHLRSRKGTPADNGRHERMHRDMAMEVEAIAAASAEDQQRACDLTLAVTRRRGRSVPLTEALAGFPVAPASRGRRVRTRSSLTLSLSGADARPRPGARFP